MFSPADGLMDLRNGDVMNLNVHHFQCRFSFLEDYSYEFGELSNSEKQAIITVIEKKGKGQKISKKLASYIANQC